MKGESPTAIAWSTSPERISVSHIQKVVAIMQVEVHPSPDQNEHRATNPFTDTREAPCSLNCSLRRQRKLLSTYGP